MAWTTCYDCKKRFKRRGAKKWERDFCKKCRPHHSRWAVTKAIVRNSNRRIAQEQRRPPPPPSQ